MVGTITVMCGVLGAFMGAILASWVSAVTYRIPRGMDIVNERSQCTACLTQIQARDNIPILGWVFLRGRCRACEASISVRYPLMELGGLFIGAIVGIVAGPLGIVAMTVVAIGVPILIHYWKAER